MRPMSNFDGQIFVIKLLLIFEKNMNFFEFNFQILFSQYALFHTREKLWVFSEMRIFP